MKDDADAMCAVIYLYFIVHMGVVIEYYFNFINRAITYLR